MLTTQYSLVKATRYACLRLEINTLYGLPAARESHKIRDINHQVLVMTALNISNQ